MVLSASKGPLPSPRIAQFLRVPRDELVDQCPLARARPQDPPYALDVLALAAAAGHDDADLRLRNIEVLVEHPRRDKRSKSSLAKERKGSIALLSADVAGERHDEVLASDRVGRLVVTHEHERARLVMVVEQPAEQRPLRRREGEQATCAMESGDARRPSSVRPAARTNSSQPAPGLNRRKRVITSRNVRSSASYSPASPNRRDGQSVEGQVRYLWPILYLV
jgi:hypothetical protein